MLAAAGRSKARDIADLAATTARSGHSCLAAAGKPPNFSPRRTIDEIRRHALSISAEDYAAVKGLPAHWSAEFIREEALRLLDAADAYVMSAPAVLVGILAVNKDEVVIEVTEGDRREAVLRKATDEPEVMPAPAEFNAVGWGEGTA